MSRVRFALSPTGTLHLGDALSAITSRAFGDWLLLRIDDIDTAGGEEAILGDLGWLGVAWDDGPVRQSDRRERHLQAAEPLGARFEGTAIVREDGSPTSLLASVVDDIDFGITHVLRRDDDPIEARLAGALGARPPVVVRHGLILAESTTIASLRNAGIPAEAVRAYLDELGLPERDVRLDLPRIRRLAIEAIAAMPDGELAARAGAPVGLVPALRGARDLEEARDSARSILEPEPAALPPDAAPTLERFRELRARSPERLDREAARAIVRELKAVGGDLRALRLALTGRERGPELWAVLAALSGEETLARLDRF